MHSVHQLKEWIEIAKENNGTDRDVIYVLVGNKTDLEDERAVHTGKIEQLVEEHQLFFYYEVSAFNDYTSIRDLFEKISFEIVKRKLYKVER